MLSRLPGAARAGTRAQAPTGAPPPRNRRRARQAAQVNAAPATRRSPRKHQVSSPFPLAPRKPRRARKAQVQVSALGQAPDVQPISHAALTALSEPVALSSQIDRFLDEMAAELFPGVSRSFGENVTLHATQQDPMSFDDVAGQCLSAETTQVPSLAPPLARQLNVVTVIPPPTPLACEARDDFAAGDIASVSVSGGAAEERSAVSRTPSPAPSPHYLRDFDDEDNLILNVVGPWSRNAFGRRVLKLALTLGDAHAVRFVADSFPVQDVLDAWLWVDKKNDPSYISIYCHPFDASNRKKFF
ncbi:hypothetical protein AURDEDRAFT_159304 [Auricularia subglabra TFB-10046 SS5]|nr:hypothetical protein AURDEDRAFT_159304 [Auricularia subglabra TFB-10046 SS5]